MGVVEFLLIPVETVEIADLLRLSPVLVVHVTNSGAKRGVIVRRRQRTEVLPR